jgi:hypothetical protein
VFEQNIQATVDQAYDKEKVCELVSALQNGLAGVLACDVIENGGGKERICGAAQGIADYIVEVHAQLADGEP